MLDYIIVGQGIAGSLLSWFLLKENQKIIVVDKFNPSSASHIASGIINPIIGRRFVKTWLADELIPFAEKTYRELEELFGTRFFYPASIVKIFESVQAQNDWSARCSSPEYLPYLKNDSVIHLEKSKVKNDLGGFEISGGARLETPSFLLCYREYLKTKKILVEEEFMINELHIGTNLVSYKNLQASKIIFCEGAQAITNPYFRFFPFQPAKGECLTIYAEDFYPDKIINGEVLIMPLEEKNHYYSGATHDWFFDGDRPSEKGKNELQGNLSAILTVPFKILEHKAAIRPTVKDRRPFIGFHPHFLNVGIFNGMGTKGVSLAPYFAKHFSDYLLYQKLLINEVDIKRFLS